MNGEMLILLSVGLPILGALMISLSKRDPNLREATTLVIALALLIVTSSLLGAVLAGQRPSVFLFDMIPGLTLRFDVEPLGMIFACIASLLWPINSLYSIGYMRSNNEEKQTRFYVCFAIAISSAIGIAYAGNLLTLFVFYEALTLSTYPLVTHHGDSKAMHGGRTYLSILLGTSIVFLLPAILWTWHLAGTTDFVAGGLLAGHLTGPLTGVLLALFMFGVGKAALMPFHRWLPAAMVAPTPVSALLHAVAVVKAGVFCVVKVLVYVFGYEMLRAEVSTHWLLYAAGFTMIAASIIALRQDNLKRLLAYSTVSQLSYVVLAASILSPLSTIGSVLHITAHAFGKITLFFAAGAIYTAAHKTEISQMDGIGRRMPWTMAAFSIGALSMIGLPPAAGFISKWYMLLGAMNVEHTIAAMIILVSTLLNASYFVPIVNRAFLKTEDAGTHHEHGEAPRTMVIALTTTACLTLVLFFWPDIPLELARQMIGGAP